MQTHLESPKELAMRVGWSERRIRSLARNKQIRHLWVGGNIFFPPNAIEEFIKANTVKPCSPSLNKPDVLSESRKG